MVVSSWGFKDGFWTLVRTLVIAVVVIGAFRAYSAAIHRKLAKAHASPDQELLLGSRYIRTAIAQGLGSAALEANAAYGDFIAVVDDDGVHFFDRFTVGSELPRARILAVQASAGRWNELGCTRLQFRVPGGTVSFLVYRPWLRWFNRAASRSEVEALAEHVADTLNSHPKPAGPGVS